MPPARLLIFIGLVLVLASCAARPVPAAAPQPTAVPPVAPATATPTPAPLQDSLAQQAWRDDLQFLATKLRERHPKPFYRTTAAEFDQAVRALDAAIPSLTRDQIVVGLIRITAMIDGHTQLPLNQPALGFHAYPLWLYWFSDGLYVVDALEPYRASIGARIVQIGGQAIEQVSAQLLPLAHHDNTMSARSVATLFHIVPEVLVAQGLIADPARPGIVLAYPDGRQATIDPAPITFAAYRAWRSRGLQGLPPRDDLPALSHLREAFWFELLGDSQTLYIQYNQVSSQTQSGERLSAFSRRLELLVAAQAPRRVVLDMRYNGGGDNTTYGPLLGLLQRNQAFNQPGRLYVLIGRQTFSAATNFVTELERSVAPIFVGEPTGGSPNLYGDTRPQTLPHSQLVVLISARYWQKSTPGDQRPAIEPQLAVPLASADYFAGRDPALAAALADQR